MKAAIISLGSKSSEMIAKAMKKYFSEVEMLNLKEIEVHLGKEGGIFYQEKKLPNYDCIYLKGSFRYVNLLVAIAALLERKTAYLPLSSSSYLNVHNKVLTHLLLEQKNLPMPKTYLTSTIIAAKELIKKVHYPIVMKFPEGTQGKGVMFADSISSASSLLDALGALNQPFLIQEYIETNGTDIRALVVGEKVVAAMRRKAQREEKRANIHAGGSGKEIKLSPEQIKVAVDTARILGADVCGVDILESPLGPLVIEANISPGLQGISKVVPVDIADGIAKFFYQKTEEAVQKNKKIENEKAMKDLALEESIGTENPQEIITGLVFRGEKIILPEIVTRITKFNERKEFILKIKKGKIEIEEH